MIQITMIHQHLLQKLLQLHLIHHLQLILHLQEVSIWCKKISNVNLSSSDASTPTTFRFDSPVYLQEDQEVAIVLFTPCERYFAWISRMGEQDIGTTRMISKQPHLGVLFKSQNNSTWTAYDYEDLKFTVYRASFETQMVEEH